jgi:hypothetical protein
MSACSFLKDVTSFCYWLLFLWGLEHLKLFLLLKSGFQLLRGLSLWWHFRHDDWLRIQLRNLDIARNNTVYQTPANSDRDRSVSETFSWYRLACLQCQNINTRLHLAFSESVSRQTRLLTFKSAKITGLKAWIVSMCYWSVGSHFQSKV